MCGIAGFIDSSRKLDHASLTTIAFCMARAIRHRGPDDEGAWADAERGVALGHRRLSILDLSPQGHQPMHSACGRYVVAFNGEIYNYAAIRADLDQSGLAPSWRGHSDTEVLLAAIVAWGIKRTLERSVGMFALAVWDRQDRTLHLARDRIGEKPLFYGWCGDTFLFASELKALKAHPSWQGKIDRGSLALMLRHNYIPAPFSIYSGIRKLVPGTLLSLTTEVATSAPADRNSPRIEAFWSARDVVERGVANPFRGSDDEAIEQLDTLLRNAVKLQMVSDVPLGAFLSGGVDSSTIVAMMQAQSSHPVRTFTIGFNESQYNEAQHAKAVARHLKTDHTELYVTPKDALDVIPSLPSLYDEPFADSSQVPTFLLARLARKDVTVSLSGDGGDELFAGYNRYFWGKSIWRRVGWLPQALRDAASRSARSVSVDAWDRLFDLVRPLLPGELRYKRPGENMHKLARILRSRTPDEMYQILVSHTDVPTQYVMAAAEPQTILSDESQWARLEEFVERMMYLDLVSYLPDDILVKVDRASMGVSLESRIPLLDHRVVEFAWQVPLSMKIRDGQGKWLLRQVLYKYVPKELIDRPKMGFGIPIDAWLRGPLREWCEELLSENRLRQEGFFHPHTVRQKWQEHLSGKKNWQYLLWNILMFQAWLAEQGASSH